VLISAVSCAHVLGTRRAGATVVHDAGDLAASASRSTRDGSRSVFILDVLAAAALWALTAGRWARAVRTLLAAPRFALPLGIVAGTARAQLTLVFFGDAISPARSWKGIRGRLRGPGQGRDG